MPPRSTSRGATRVSVPPAPPPTRLLIVSNRLPVTVTAVDGMPSVTPSVGGLATALRGPHEQSGGMWVGWPGETDALSDDGRRTLAAHFAEHRIVPVDLTRRELAVYYEHVSNGVLWPICHDRIDMLPLRVKGWDVYERVNARFADAVAAVWRPGDMIWVHDYQLMRLPALLRARLPTARIGLFLHIPFPNPEIFFTLPTRRWLVEGMLGADLIGFHTARYRGHFAATARRLLELGEYASDTVEHEGRTVRLGVFPIGVDAAHYDARAAMPEVLAEASRLKQADERLLVGIDRLDYSKGIPRRLLAFEQLLTDHPEWQEHVRLVQVAVPSRSGVEAYRRFRSDLDELVGRINGKFATARWTPIHYLYRSVPEEMLLALYRAADLMLVTPVRDGMNLVAKEFVASRSDEDGVLVLSEFAGAAAELSDAVIVNPYDVDGTAAAMHRALGMSRTQRRTQMRAMRRLVARNDVHAWVRAFLASLSHKSA